ncbi:MAG: TetR/AcrR family transcriptional regulator [Erysipelotrichales bacterium]
MNKELILKASFKLIQKTGLEGFSMRKLAEALKCQPASIYHYYKNKNDILNDLYVELNKLFFEFEIETDDLEEFLFETCKNIQVHYKEYLFVLRYSRSGFLKKENKELFVKMRNNHAAQLKKIVGCEHKHDVSVRLIIMGSIIEMAFLNSHYKLSDEELQNLAKRICIAVRSDVSETVS